MTITTNDRIVAVATVVTDGDLEIIERDPFAARLGEVSLQTFVFDPAHITVLELFVPIAQVAPSAAVDRWIARIAPKLFNIHVAARDFDDATLVEVRTSLIADGLTVEMFDSALTLLAAGATAVADDLRHVLAASSAPSSETTPSTSSPVTPLPELPVCAGDMPTNSVSYAGYL